MKLKLVKKCQIGALMAMPLVNNAQDRIDQGEVKRGKNPLNNSNNQLVHQDSAIVNGQVKPLWVYQNSNGFGAYVPEDTKLEEAKVSTQKHFSMYDPTRPDFSNDKTVLRNNAAKLQQSLINLNYNPGKVDNIWGKRSQAALDAAIADGWFVGSDGALHKQGDAQKYFDAFAKQSTQPTMDLQAEALRIAKQLQPKAEIKPAEPEYKVATPADSGWWLGKNIMNKFYDNTYPYSYGDKMQPDGTLKQITGDDSSVEQIVGMYDKGKAAFKEMDPRRKLMNELADLDLNTPEGIAAWRKLAPEAKKKQVIRAWGTDENKMRNQQWEMRARLDAMNLYQGRNQKWNTFVEQSDPNLLSGAATRAGRPTLIPGDKKQRDRIYGEMANYYNQNKHKAIYDPEKNIYRLPFMSYLGNATIVYDPTDESVRYTDNWDYVWTRDNDKNRPYFGTVLDVKNVDPKLGIGVNSGGMSESTSGLIKKAAKEMISGDVDYEAIKKQRVR